MIEAAKQPVIPAVTSLDEIKNIRVHWSENTWINQIMGCDDDCDIEKDIAPILFDKLIRDARQHVEGETSDKTCLTVELESGERLCTEKKFYLRAKTIDLIGLVQMCFWRRTVAD